MRRIPIMLYTFREGIQSKCNDSALGEKATGLERYRDETRERRGERKTTTSASFLVPLLLQWSSREGVAATPTHVVEIDKR